MFTNVKNFQLSGGFAMRASEIRDSRQLITPSDLSPAAAAFRPPRGVEGQTKLEKK